MYKLFEISASEKTGMNNIISNNMIAELAYTLFFLFKS